MQRHQVLIDAIGFCEASIANAEGWAHRYAQYLSTEVRAARRAWLQREIVRYRAVIADRRGLIVRHRAELGALTINDIQRSAV